MLFFDHLRSKNGKYGKANLESCQKMVNYFLSAGFQKGQVLDLNLPRRGRRARRAHSVPKGDAAQRARSAPFFPQVRFSILICPEGAEGPRARRALFRPEGAAPRSGREAPRFSPGQVLDFNLPRRGRGDAAQRLVLYIKRKSLSVCLSVSLIRENGAKNRKTKTAGRIFEIRGVF